MHDDQFAVAYTDSFDRLVARCYALCGDLRAAEIAAQEAFVRAWNERSELGDAHALDLAVWATATRLLRQGWPARHPGLAHLSAPAPTPERVELQRHLATLPTVSRRALLDHDIAGWNLVETADDVRRPVDSIAAIIDDARAVADERPEWRAAATSVGATGMSAADVARVAQRRTHRRSATAIGVGISALALLAGTAVVSMQHEPPRPVPSATPGSECKMHWSWYDALSPAGEPWGNLLDAVPDQRGVVTTEESDGEQRVVWYQEQRPKNPVVVATAPAPERADLRAIVATDDIVVWSRTQQTRPGVPELYVWDHHDTRQLSTHVRGVTLVDGALYFVDLAPAADAISPSAPAASAAPMPPTWALRRFDIASGSTSTVRKGPLGSFAPYLGDGFLYVPDPSASTVVVDDLKGKHIVDINAQEVPVIIGRDGDRPLWAKGNAVHTVVDGEDRELWHLDAPDAAEAFRDASAGGGYIVYNRHDSIGVYDIRTGHHSERSRYRSPDGWVAHASIAPNGRSVSYAGSGPIGRHGPDAVRGADGGPNFSAVDGRQRIVC